VCRLDGARDDSPKLLAERGQVDLLAHALAESVERRLGVVTGPVEAPIDRPLERPGIVTAAGHG
jgi:hypothetical protein